MLSEKDLWRQLIGQGDEKAFEVIFHLYFERLCYFAKDYVQDMEVSRELTQETFTRLWEIKDTLNEDSNIKSLLYTIVRNNALNYLKHEFIKKKYNKNTIDNYNRLQLNAISLSDMKIEKLTSDDLRKQIEKIVDGLPEKCRAAFIMSRNLGLSYKEIARQMDVSVNTVENHIALALKKIRNMLKEN